MKRPNYELRITNYVLLIALFVFPSKIAHAVALDNPLAVESIPELAGTIIKALLGFTGSVALLIFVYGGFLWLTSAGNPERIQKGRDTLVWAAIGLAFIFSSYMIANFIIQALTGQL